MVTPKCSDTSSISSKPVQSNPLIMGISKAGLLELRFDSDREATSAFHGLSLIARSDQTLWVAGRIKLLDGVIVHVEGKDYASVDQAIDRSALLIPNPEANIFTDIVYTGKYGLHIAVSILLYVLLLLPLWCRVASWAATVLPKPALSLSVSLNSDSGCWLLTKRIHRFRLSREKRGKLILSGVWLMPNGQVF